MGTFGGINVWQKWKDEDFGKKVWEMNRSAIRLIIVTTNLDGFKLGRSLMIHKICQTFLLYGICEHYVEYITYSNYLDNGIHTRFTY